MHGETKRQETTHATKDVATRRLLQKEMRETIALHPTDYRLGGKDVLVLVFADQRHAIEFVSAAKMLLIQGRHGLQWFTIQAVASIYGLLFLPYGRRARTTLS